jgi:hypothetical protein
MKDLKASINFAVPYHQNVKNIIYFCQSCHGNFILIRMAITMPDASIAM